MVNKADAVGDDLDQSFDAFQYGEMLLKRFPKDGNEAKALITQFTARETLDRERLERVELEHRQRLEGELSETLRVSNTQLPTSNSSLQTRLEMDQKLFDELPTGGGGIDWLNVSITNGLISEAGWEIRTMFLQERDRARMNGEKKALVSLPGIEEPFLVHSTAVGQGASKQPLMVHWRGLVIRYGKTKESYPSTGGYYGSLGVIECSGKPCLELGEVGMCKAMHTLCQVLGITVRGCRATRMDACADLPDCDIEPICKAMFRGDVVSRAKHKDVHWVGAKMTGITAETQGIKLNAYEKVQELLASGDVEKMELMIKNRWGYLPEKAVRVEYQFTLSHLSKMHFGSLEELFEGLGVLLEWACNDWFRLAEVNSRTNTSRARVLGWWLRVCHAFAYWAGRFNTRPAARPITPAAPHRMCQQAAGLHTSILVRMGYRVCSSDDSKLILPDGKTVLIDDNTGWDVLAVYKKPSEIMALLKARAAIWDAKRGRTAPDEQDPECCDNPDCGAILFVGANGVEATCHACGGLTGGW